MGLDMYLYAYNYICYSQNPKRKEVVVKISELFPELNGIPVNKVQITAGYWRKAYVIHNWFVKHVQDDKDDCREYPFYEEHVKDLIDTINKVLEDHSKAPKLLPDIVEIRIAFGGKAYDEYYFQELENAKKLLEGKVMDLMKHGWEFTYRSSW